MRLANQNLQLIPLSEPHKLVTVTNHIWALTEIWTHIRLSLMIVSIFIWIKNNRWFIFNSDIPVFKTT